MRDGWREVQLLEVVRRRKEPVAVADEPSYRLLGIRWKHLGAYMRGDSETTPAKASTMYRMREGDFTFNRIDTDKGAFAVVGPELDGALASNEFPAYRCDEDALLADYLWLHFQRPEVFTVLRGSGSEGRARWKESDFESHLLPLPPIAEQRRIVDLISALDDAVAGVQDCRERMARLQAQLPASVVQRSASEEWDLTTLGSVLGGDDAIRTGPFGSQLHQSDYVEDGPVAVIMPANMYAGRVDLANAARISQSDADRLSRHSTRTGDILWSRRGDVTRFAVIDDESAGTLCGTGCFLIRPNDPADVGWLEVWLSAPTTGKWLVEHSVGATMANLNRTILSNIPVAAPPASERKALAESWRAMRAVGRDTERSERDLRMLRSHLLTALLSGEHVIPESYDELMEVAS